MAAAKTIFRCKHCGNSRPQLANQCPECRLWDGYVEVNAANIPPATVSANSKISQSVNFDIRPTGDDLFDAIMGGGVVPGTRILFAGSEGSGKSTSSMQLAKAVAKKSKVLYVTGEEKTKRILARARRLGAASANILITELINAGSIVELAVKEKCKLVIIDSVNTTLDGSGKGDVGSPSQIKAVVKRIAQLQDAEITTLFLAHLNAKGDIGGVRWLRHMVDAVIKLSKDDSTGIRTIVAVKNRDGETHKPIDLEMTNIGLKMLDIVRVKREKFEKTQDKLKLIPKDSAS